MKHMKMLSSTTPKNPSASLTVRSSRGAPVRKGLLTGWAGFACRNANAIARAANLDGSTHKLTDEILAELVSKYAEANDGLNPDAIFVTFAQRLLLQKSRGTTVRTSARSSIEITAGVPLEYDGIPIIATNSLVNTEAVWSAE